MKLIKKLSTRRNKNNHLDSWGLFYCKYCNKEIEKRRDSGLKCKSCGCSSGKLTGESHITHGYTQNRQRTRLYQTWADMKKRCYNENQIQYKNYGGRGITVCDKWKNNYLTFKTWALGNGYKNKLTIDRINNNGNYEPFNCQWSTHKEQNRNQTRTKLTIKKVQQIRNIYNNIKITKTLLGKIFNVSGKHIGNIVNNKSWIN